MFRATLFSLALLSLTNPALADEVSDTLSSALTAYEEGDIDYALEELEYAKQLLKEMKTGELTEFLPEAPDGWTREINTEMTAGMAFMGGGVGAEAEYTDGTETVTITLAANNPMVSGFAGMIQAAGLMGGKIEKVGREKFIFMDGELTGIIDNRILVQAKGGEVDLMKDLLGEIDFKALEDFGG